MNVSAMYAAMHAATHLDACMLTCMLQCISTYQDKLIACSFVECMLQCMPQCIPQCMLRYYKFNQGFVAKIEATEKRCMPRRLCLNRKTGFMHRVLSTFEEAGLDAKTYC